VGSVVATVLSVPKDRLRLSASEPEG
jgi:hypothetical protein